MSNLLKTKNLHSLVNKTLERHSCKKKSSKTRMIYYFAIPKGVDRGSEVRRVEYFIIYPERDNMLKALEELRVFLLLSGYTLELKPQWRQWSNTIKLEIFARIN